jgi:hypothetical protein
VLPAFFVFYLGLAPMGVITTIDPSIQSTVDDFHQRKMEKPIETVVIGQTDGAAEKTANPIQADS